MRNALLALLAIFYISPVMAQEMTDDDRVKQMEKRVQEECIVQSGSTELCACINKDLKKNMVEKEYRFIMITGYYTMNFALQDINQAYQRFGYTTADNEGLFNRLKAAEDAAEEKCDALYPITPSSDDATNP